MVHITNNYSKLLNFLLDTLDRKPVTDIQARNNYKQVIVDYSTFLYSLVPLTLNDKSPLMKHYKYLQELDVLIGRYDMIGDDTVDKLDLEDFLLELQNKMRNYLHNDLETELYKEEAKYYSHKAFVKESPMGKDNDYKFQDEHKQLIQSTFEKYKGTALDNLGK